MPEWLKEILDPTPFGMAIWMMCIGWSVTNMPAIIPEPLPIREDLYNNELG